MRVRLCAAALTVHFRPSFPSVPHGGWPIPVSELVFDVDGVPVIDEQDLETTCRVLQLFARFPEAALPARFARDSNEYTVRSNIRVNAMRWIRPTGIARRFFSPSSVPLSLCLSSLPHNYPIASLAIWFRCAQRARRHPRSQR